MTVRRVMGIETEYGLIEPGNAWANPVEMSTRIVRAYAAGVPHAPWDYAGEDPLSDARGYRLPRAAAHPSQLTDSPAPPDRGSLRGGPANAVLPNGARLYVDHAHPEYSSPEVTGPLDALRWDRAGDEVMIEAMRAVGSPEIVIYKNNVDGKGASYGTHENYLVRRSVPFRELAQRLTPFFVTRPVVCGAGRVGLGQRSQEPGFQVSQRADYVENDIGLETTFNRPIVNTRDEPHADPGRWRRLHVIGGDANRFDVPAHLKFATTALMLWLVEEDHLPLELDALTLSAPVVDTWGVSHDPFGHVLSTEGATRTALDVQRTYLDVVARHVGDDAETTFALELWDAVLTGLATDPDSVAHQVEWVAKRQLLEGLRRRGNLSWDNPRLAALDLQWADLRPEHSVVARLDTAGRVQRLVDQAEVHEAVSTPPADTRAWFRGTMVQRFPRALAAAGWSSVVVDSGGSLVRIPLTDPLRGSRARAARLFESNDVETLLSILGGE
ncbi:MAG: depupylase/deamidase Dop [Actinomycetota bacterium]